MKAVRLTGPRTLEEIDRGTPALLPGHALVRVDLVGLCGSDLSYFAKGANGDFEVRAPLVLGHEIVGTVVATTAGVATMAGDEPAEAVAVGETVAVGEAVAVGDRVAVHPVWPCPRPGEREVAADLLDEVPSFLGSASTWPHTDGGLQEHLSVRTERLRVIPPELPSATAVLAEPTAVVLHALSRAGDPTGLDAVVCGAGPIGLLAVLALRQAGARRITVTDVRSAPLALARRIGADAVIDLSSERPAASCADLVIEASGVPASLESAAAMARAGGTIVQLGMLPRDQRPIALSAIVTKELRVLGTHRFTGEFDDALRLLSASPDAAEIATTVRSLDDTAGAFAAMADPTVTGKVVVDVSGSLGRRG